MADALCGPSNALQTFKQNTSVDRSLQQDRLSLRQSPRQGFRSSSGPQFSNIDAEFQAFQSNISLSGAQSPLHHQPLPHFQQAPKPQLPDWASDFQQSSLHSPQQSSFSPVPLRHDAPLQRNSPATGWHEDFMRHNDQASLHNSNVNVGYTGMSSQMPMQHFNSMNASSAYMLPFAQEQNQHIPQDRGGIFDDAAFARAFDAAQQEAEQSVSKGKGRAQESEPITFDMSHACTDPGDVTGNFDFDSVSDRMHEEGDIVEELRTMRQDVGWQALRAFERAHEHEIEQSNSQRSRDIVDAIRSMRAEEEAVNLQSAPTEEPVRIGADTIPAQNEQQKLSPDAEADELSRTAGQLLDNLRQEESTKFQQSNFMELMRQLRDKEVRVEGDKMDKIQQAPHPGGKFYPSDAFPDNSTQAQSESRRESEHMQAGG